MALMHGTLGDRRPAGTGLDTQILLGEHAGIAGDQVRRTRPRAPTTEEIEIATSDAQCRESSGWTSLLYEVTWGQQAAFLEAHEAEVDARLAHNATQTEQVRAIIRDHGGKV